jgi:hypothetical protein
MVEAVGTCAGSSPTAEAELLVLARVLTATPRTAAKKAPKAVPPSLLAKVTLRDAPNTAPNLERMRSVQCSGAALVYGTRRRALQLVWPARKIAIDE